MILAHIAGVPVEETIAMLAPVATLWATLLVLKIADVRAGLRSRRRRCIDVAESAPGTKKKPQVEPLGDNPYGIGGSR